MGVFALPPRQGAEVRFICSASARVTRLQVNSPVSSMKATASFRFSEENITMLGREEIALKKL